MLNGIPFIKLHSKDGTEQKTHLRYLLTACKTFNSIPSIFYGRNFSAWRWNLWIFELDAKNLCRNYADIFDSVHFEANKHELIHFSTTMFHFQSREFSLQTSLLAEKWLFVQVFGNYCIIANSSRPPKRLCVCVCVKFADDLNHWSQINERI